MVAALAAAIAPAAVMAQTAPPTTSLGCAPAAARPPATPVRAAAEARRLGLAAQEAILLGDLAVARELLARATSLDPATPRLAYHHARVLEELGHFDDAFREYCRTLALLPPDAETEEIRRHIQEIAPRRVSLPHPVVANESARNHPDAPHRERPQAVSPPERSTRNAEPQAPFNPVVAFSAGLVVPGLGQFYTRRPTLGAAVFAATASAVYVALRTRDVPAGSTSRLRAEGSLLLDKNDSKCGKKKNPCPPPTTPPPSTPSLPQPPLVTDRPSKRPPFPSAPNRERPYFAAGIGAAAAITILSATEALLYASPTRAGRPAPRAALELYGPIQLAPPTLVSTGAEPRLELGLRIGVW